MRGMVRGAGILLFALLFGCTEQQQQQSPNEHVAAGEVYLEQGQFRAALIEVENALALDAGNEPAIVLQARLNSEIGNFRYAYRLLEQYDGESPEYFQTLVEAYLNSRKYSSAMLTLRQNKAKFSDVPAEGQIYIGRAFVGLDDPDAAEKAFKEALRLDPGNIKARIGLVTLLGIRGDLIGAEFELDRILTDAPDNVNALTLLTAVYVTQGRLDEAEEVLTRTIAALPTTDIYTMQRAAVIQTLISLLAQQGRTGEALIYQRTLAEAFPEAEQNNQKFTEALSKLESGDLASAEATLRELYESAPGHPTGGALLGLLNFVQGRDDDAARYFTDAVDLETASAPVLKAMALNLYRMNQPQRIVDSLRQRITTITDPETQAVYALAAFNAGENAEGYAAIKRAIRLDPEKARYRLVLTDFHMREQPPQHDAAIEVLETGLSALPDDIEMVGGYLNQLIIMDRDGEAEQLLGKQLDRNPDDYQTNLLAGSTWLQMGNLDRSLQFYRKARELAPDRKPAYMGLAVVSLRQQRYQQSRAYFKQVLGLDSADLAAYRGILQSYLQEGVPEEGIRELETFSGADTEAASTVLAEYHATNNSLDEAQAVVDRLASRNVETHQTRVLRAEIHYRRALEHAAADRLGDARSELFEALSALPLNLRLLAKLAQLEIDAGRYGEAKKVLAEIRTHHPSAPVVDEIAGDIALAQRQFVSAKVSYGQAWDAAKNDVNAMKLIAALEAGGEAAEITRVIREWREALPQSIRALEYDVRAQGDDNRAIAEYEAYLESWPDTPAVLNNLAWRYLEVGQAAAGLAYARQAVAIAPDTAAVLDTLGWLQFQTGDGKEAAKNLRRAAALAPDNEEIRTHLEAVTGPKGEG